MIPLFKSLLELASQQGIHAAINLIVAIMALIYLLVHFKNGKVPDLIYRIVSNRTRKEQEKLKNHYVFSQLTDYINKDIQYLTIPEAYREAVLKDFLLFKFTSIKKEITVFLSKGDLEAMTPEAYKERLLECVTRIVQEYETKSIREGISDKVIRKFNYWHADRVNKLLKWIDTVCEPEGFKTNTKRTRVFLDFLVILNEETISDARKTLILMNGELTGLIYKGITCVPL